MNMKENPTAGQNTDMRYRSLLIIWGAQLSSLSLFFLLTIFIERPTVAGDADALRWIFPALGCLLVLLSFVLKSRIVAQAVERQDAGRVLVGYIVGFAICEMAGLLGLLLYFMRGASVQYYFLFALAALGLLLHAPRRSHLSDASFKREGLGTNQF